MSLPWQTVAPKRKFKPPLLKTSSSQLSISHSRSSSTLTPTPKPNVSASTSIHTNLASQSDSSSPLIPTQLNQSAALPEKPVVLFKTIESLVRTQVEAQQNGDKKLDEFISSVLKRLDQLQQDLTGLKAYQESGQVGQAIREACEGELARLRGVVDGYKYSRTLLASETGTMSVDQGGATGFETPLVVRDPIITSTGWGDNNAGQPTTSTISPMQEMSLLPGQSISTSLAASYPQELAPTSTATTALIPPETKPRGRFAQLDSLDDEVQPPTTPLGIDVPVSDLPLCPTLSLSAFRPSEDIAQRTSSLPHVGLRDICHTPSHPPVAGKSLVDMAKLITSKEELHSASGGKSIVDLASLMPVDEYLHSQDSSTLSEIEDPAEPLITQEETDKNDNDEGSNRKRQRTSASASQTPTQPERSKPAAGKKKQTPRSCQRTTSVESQVPSSQPRKRRQSSTPRSGILPPSALARSDGKQRVKGAVWPKKGPNTPEGLGQEILCDSCLGRAHWSCAGLTADQMAIDENWTCPDCAYWIGRRMPIPDRPVDRCIRSNCLRRENKKLVTQPEAPQLFSIERVIGRRRLPSSPGDAQVHFLYLVKWWGYPLSEASWEPESSFSALDAIAAKFCEDALDEAMDFRSPVMLLEEAEEEFDAAGVRKVKSKSRK